MTTAVVFGYGDVGIRCLATLLAQGVTVPLVVTHPDDPAEALWYGSLARFAQERDIPVHLSADADADELHAQLVALKPDLLFSFYYRRMLPQRLLAVPRSGAYNLHGSLLPQFRGRAPVNWVCVHGATQTGASLHVMTAKPDYLVMGMSAVTFFDGAKGAEAFQEKVEGVSGVKLSMGSKACAQALTVYGGVKRIAVLSPYWPVMNTEVARYFGDMGFDVVRDIPLQCRSWTNIAEQTTATLRDALRKLDGDDVDAIVQVGTNLSMVRLAAAAEMWLGKPVIAINTATYWHALRANGIHDKIEGLGRLLEEF